MSTPSLARMARIRLSWGKERAEAAAAASVVRAYRVAAARKPVRDGVTVISVNYHSLPHLRALLDGLERYTTDPIDVLVLDNGSKDGSRDFLRSHPEVRSILLPVNLGHAAALDLGVLAADTSIVVTFDIDAFPISKEWLSALTEPLEKGARVAGAHFHRSYIHPCFLALRRSDFVGHRLSFAALGHWPKGDVPASGVYMDVGEAVSHMLAVIYGTNAVHKIPVTSTRGPGPIGTVFGDIAYHNFASTHGQGEHKKWAAEAWDNAVRQYLS
jgi:glycosyltransferase involved in cell wall biosynthesis